MLPHTIDMNHRDIACVQHVNVGFAQACPNEKSTVQITSVGLPQVRPNYHIFAQKRTTKEWLKIFDFKNGMKELSSTLLNAALALSI